MSAAVDLEVIRTLPEGLPERTLGYKVIEWAEANLRSPEGEGPLQLTREQGRFVLWWYAVDEVGDFLYRRGVIRRAKGWGKDPLAATLCIVELMGPCRFDGWGEDGEPLARPERAADVRLGAVAEKQTQNTSDLFGPLIPPSLRDDYNLDFKKKIWRVNVDGMESKIQPITANAQSEEGARPTFFVANETWHWTESNQCKKMAETVEANLTKRNGRVLALTNAHAPGQESVAEDDWKAWQAQQEPDYLGRRDILYDSVEAKMPPDYDWSDDDLLLAALRVAYGDSYWVNIERRLAEMRDPKREKAESQRRYLNHIVAGTGQWLEPELWSAAYDPEFAPSRGSEIALGFDGARRRDSTALVATEMSSGRQWVYGIWERDWGIPDWEVPEEEVDEAVKRAFRDHRVIRMYCDPFYWQERVNLWCGEYEGVASEWRTGGPGTTKTAVAVHAYRQAISELACRHGGPGDDLFTRDVLRTYAMEINGRIGDEPLVIMAKENRGSRRTIDLAMAGCLSWQARLDAIKAGWNARRRLRVRLVA